MHEVKRSSITTVKEMEARRDQVSTLEAGRVEYGDGVCGKKVLEVQDEVTFREAVARVGKPVAVSARYSGGKAYKILKRVVPKDVRDFRKSPIISLSKNLRKKSKVKEFIAHRRFCLHMRNFIVEEKSGVTKSM